MSLSFLMCSERSGSNLITKLLNAHKNICGPSTKHILNPVARNLFRYGDLTAEENWNELLRDIYTLISCDFSIWKSTLGFEDLTNLAQTGDIKSLIKEIYLFEAKANDKDHVFIKENKGYEFLTFLLLHFPESKFIYQVRDPRDMALSWRNNKNHSGGILKAAKQWSYDQKHFIADYNSLQRFGKAHHIKYEDLISNPKGVLTEVLYFLGFNFHDEILNFHSDKITVENSKKQEAWHNLSKPILPNNSNKYAFQLSREEIAIIEKICFYEMKALGYEPGNSFDQLQNISESFLDEFEAMEALRHPAEPSKGTLENINAKRKFYLR